MSTLSSIVAAVQGRQSLALPAVLLLSFIALLIVYSLTTPHTTWETAKSGTSRADRLQNAVNALSFLQHIREHERRIYSQNGEDGVLEYIFDNINSTDKYYVEFGTQDATQCNTRFLWERYNFTGQLIDLDRKSKDARVILNRMITAENIVSIFEEASVPLSRPFDLLSVDIDGNDYHVARSIFLAGYRPRVFIAEINRCFGPNDAFVITYNSSHRWLRKSHFGSSARAWQILLNLLDYHLVYQDKQGINVFFIYRPALLEYVLQPKFRLTCLPTISELIDKALPRFETVYSRQKPTSANFYEELVEDNWSVVLPDGFTRTATKEEKEAVRFA